MPASARGDHSRWIRCIGPSHEWQRIGVRAKHALHIHVGPSCARIARSSGSLHCGHSTANASRSFVASEAARKQRRGNLNRRLQSNLTLLPGPQDAAAERCIDVQCLVFLFHMHPEHLPRPPLRRRHPSDPQNVTRHKSERSRTSSPPCTPMHIARHWCTRDEKAHSRRDNFHVRQNMPSYRVDTSSADSSAVRSHRRSRLPKRPWASRAIDKARVSSDPLAASIPF